MIGSIIILVLVGLLSYSVIKLIYDYKKERKELEQEYENVKIGDKYKSVYHNNNPFEGDYVFKVTIIGKKDGWVQYEHDDGSKNECSYDDFVNFWYYHKI